jgi:hypothetical protein
LSSPPLDDADVVVFKFFLVPGRLYRCGLILLAKLTAVYFITQSNNVHFKTLFEEVVVAVVFVVVVVSLAVAEIETG